MRRLARALGTLWLVIVAHVMSSAATRYADTSTIRLTTGVPRYVRATTQAGQSYVLNMTAASVFSELSMALYRGQPNTPAGQILVADVLTNVPCNCECYPIPWWCWLLGWATFGIASCPLAWEAACEAGVKECDQCVDTQLSYGTGGNVLSSTVMATIDITLPGRSERLTAGLDLEAYDGNFTVQLMSATADAVRANSIVCTAHNCTAELAALADTCGNPGRLPSLVGTCGYSWSFTPNGPVVEQLSQTLYTRDMGGDVFLYIESAAGPLQVEEIVPCYETPTNCTCRNQGQTVCCETSCAPGSAVLLDAGSGAMASANANGEVCMVGATYERVYGEIPCALLYDMGFYGPLVVSSATAESIPGHYQAAVAGGSSSCGLFDTSCGSGLSLIDIIIIVVAGVSFIGLVILVVCCCARRASAATAMPIAFADRISPGLHVVEVVGPRGCNCTIFTNSSSYALSKDQVAHATAIVVKEPVRVTCCDFDEGTWCTGPTSQSPYRMVLGCALWSTAACPFARSSVEQISYKWAMSSALEQTATVIAAVFLAGLVGVIVHASVAARLASRRRM